MLYGYLYLEASEKLWSSSILSRLPNAYGGEASLTSAIDSRDEWVPELVSESPVIHTETTGMQTHDARNPRLGALKPIESIEP